MDEDEDDTEEEEEGKEEGDEERKRKREEGDEERKRKVKKREHERGYRRDTNTQEILSSLLMFCFFALCFVCPLPVLLIWTPRPVANVHTGTYKSLTYTPHNLCQICTEYVNLV